MENNDRKYLKFEVHGVQGEIMKELNLVPDFKALVDSLIQGAEIETGLDWVVTSGRRTMAEQKALYDQGRKTPGPIVTKASPGYSAHNYGLAVDLAPMRNGKIWWDAPDAIWRQMADVAVRLQLTAGYYFKGFQDKPHVEAPEWKTYRDAWKSGGLSLI